MAAYLTLPGEESDRVARSERTPEGMVIDYAKDGREVGIEILDSCPETLEALLALMKHLGVPDAEREIQPLRQQMAAASAR